MTPINYGELVGILVLGALHVIIELLFGGVVAILYTSAVVLFIIGYLTFRVAHGKRVLLREWGFKKENFLASFRFQLPYLVVITIVLFGVGIWLGNMPLPPSFFIVLLLYPLWGLAQQFALQNFLVRNLTSLLPNPFLRAVVSSLFFSLSHIPNTSLVLLSFFAGVFLTLIYTRVSNIWAIGITHGVLGTLAVYLVLGINPITQFNALL